MGSEKKSPRSARVTAIGVLGVVLAGLGAAITMASHEPSSQIARLSTVDAAPFRIPAEPIADAAPSRIAAEPIADAAPPQLAAKPTAQAAASPSAAKPTAKKAPAARPQAKATITASASPIPVTSVSAMPVTRPAEAETEAAPKASSVEAAASPVAPEATPVTITGCLERDDEKFRLKDTTGADAPKSRSWKKGFLKRGMAPIEVVDAANRLSLSSHVGQRVSVTGVLVNREMTLRSLQRVSAPCD